MLLRLANIQVNQCQIKIGFVARMPQIYLSSGSSSFESFPPTDGRDGGSTIVAPHTSAGSRHTIVSIFTQTNFVSIFLVGQILGLSESETLTTTSIITDKESYHLRSEVGPPHPFSLEQILAGQWLQNLQFCPNPSSQSPGCLKLEHLNEKSFICCDS